MQANMVLLYTNTKPEPTLEPDLGWSKNNLTYLNGSKYSEQCVIQRKNGFIYLSHMDEHGSDPVVGNTKNKYLNEFFEKRINTKSATFGPVFVMKLKACGPGEEEETPVELTEKDVAEITNILKYW